MRKLIKNIKGYKPKNFNNQTCSEAFYGFRKTTAGGKSGK